MSLIEITVAMGVASVLMLGVMSLVNFSQKAAKNVGINSEWNNLTSNIQQSLALTRVCEGMFAGRILDNGTPRAWVPNPNPSAKATYSATPAPTGEPIYVLQDAFFTPAPSNAPRVMSPLAVTAPTGWNYGSFGLRSMTLIPSPTVGYTDVPLPNPLGGSSLYRRYAVQLQLVGEKMTIGTGAGSEVSATGGRTLHKTIDFFITTGPIPNTDIYTCQGIDPSAQACQDLGGFPVPPVGVAGYKCRIPKIMFTNANGSPSHDPGPAGPGAMDGEVIQLQAKTPGSPSPEDSAIGVNANAVWFNVGELDGSGPPSYYEWHYTTAAHNWTSMSLANNVIYGGVPPVHAVRLTIAQPTGLPAGSLIKSELVLGQNPSGETVGISSTQDSPVPLEVHSLALRTHSRDRLVIQDSGQTALTATSGGFMILDLGDVNGNGPRITSNPTTGDVVLRTRFDGTGNIALGQAGLGTLSVGMQNTFFSGSAIVSNNLTVNNSLNVNGTGGLGGNVPFSCRKVVNNCLAHTCDAACAADEVPIAGGGECNGGSTREPVSDSHPMGGAGPLTPGGVWRAACHINANNAVAYAICCKM